MHHHHETIPNGAIIHIDWAMFLASFSGALGTGYNTGSILDGTTMAFLLVEGTLGSFRWTGPQLFVVRLVPR